MKNQKIILAIVVVVIVLAGGFWLLKLRSPATPVPDVKVSEEMRKIGAVTAEKFEEDPNTPASVKGQIIRIDDQIPDTMVVIAQANLKVPGWVVIHENNNGQPGNIIGSRLFGLGGPSGLIKLSKTTKAGQTYFAMLHTFSGSLDTTAKPFDPKVNLPTLDSAGNPIMTVFKVVNMKD